jgi:hypothetical protein
VSNGYCEKAIGLDLTATVEDVELRTMPIYRYVGKWLID